MPMRQPLLLSAVLLSGLFLPALLHPFVEPWTVVAIVIGVALSARIPPLAQRLSERQRLRRSGVLRAIVLSCTTVVVVLGSLEYLAFALSDLGVVQHLTPMRTVLAPGTEDLRLVLHPPLVLSGCWPATLPAAISLPAGNATWTTR